MTARRTAPPKGSALYRRIWRVVDGAVTDAFTMHPDYLTPKGTKGRTARLSVVKRVTGAMTSFVEESTRGRNGKP